MYDCEEVYCVWQNRLLDDLLVELELDFFVYDQENDCYYRESELFCERAYTHDFISALLKKNRFELLAVYDDDSQNALHAQSQRAVYVARKL